MKKMFFLVAAFAFMTAGVNQTQAVELLISGNFETPGGATGEVPFWTLLESVTGSPDMVDSASITGGADARLFLKAFAGGGPLTPVQGNFDNDGLPAGDVDGRDFLLWQRNFGRTDALPTDGDATGDMMVNGDDLARWQSNYGTSAAGRFTNASLSQKLPAVPGDTYTFQGTSEFEDFYSGFVTTLGDVSPHGQIPSPTTTQFRMEFLDSQGNVIPGGPAPLDLRTEQTFPGFPIVHSPVVGVAPANAFDVRVVAEALNMAWNGSSTQTTPGEKQSAYFNDFSLTRSGAAGDLLMERNGNLNADIPDALDFWNQIETPNDFTPFDQILRTPMANFSNHTPLPPGSIGRGVWLSAFFGFADPPGDGVWSTDEAVTGIISQTVGAVEGGSYTFSGWTKFETNYSGGVDTIIPGTSGLLPPGTTSPTRTEITLEFFDADGVTDPNGPLLTLTIDAEAERKMQEDLADDGLANGTGTANDNVWRQHILAGVAPAGSRFAKLTAQMIDGVFHSGGQQSAFFDDFSLDGPAPPGGLLANVTVPEPTSFVMLAFGLAAVGLRRAKRVS